MTSRADDLRAGRSADADPADGIVDTGLEYRPGDPVQVWIVRRERRVSVSDHGAALRKAGAEPGWERACARCTRSWTSTSLAAGSCGCPSSPSGPSEQEVARRIGHASLIFFQELLELDPL